MSHSEITLREITRMVSGVAHSHEIIAFATAQIRDCLEITLDARDLAIEILRTHTRDFKRYHLALARSGHGYRLIGQLCAGCIMHVRLALLALGGVCSPQLQSARRLKCLARGAASRPVAR